MSSVDDILDELREEFGTDFEELGVTWVGLRGDLFEAFKICFGVTDEDMGGFDELPAGSPSGTEIKNKAQAPYKAMAYLLAAAIRGTGSDD